MFTNIVSIIIPYIYILSFTAGLVICSKKTFGQCLPVTLFSTPLIILIPALIFNSLTPGIYLNYLLGFVGLASAIAIFFIPIYATKRILFKSNYLTHGLLAFTIIYIGFSLFDFNRIFIAWDSFSHWGPMVKEMLRSNHLYAAKGTLLATHPDYPAMLQLLELFWLKLCGGVFNESALIRCIHIFEFSLLVPFLEFNKKNHLTKVLPRILASIICAYLIVLSMDRHGIINTIYLDYPTGILVAFALVSVLTCNATDTFNILYLALTFCTLIMTKQISICFVAMCAFAYFLISLYAKKGVVKSFFFTILISAPAVILYKIWDIYTSLTGAKENAQFDYTNTSFSNIPAILSGTFPAEWKNQIPQLFMDKMLHYNISNSRFLHMTYPVVAVLSLAIFIAVCVIYRKNLDSKKSVIGCITLTLGLIGYTTVIFISYLLFFCADEALNVDNFERYLGTYIISILISALMYLLNGIKTNPPRTKILPLYIFTGIMIALYGYNYQIMPHITPQGLDNKGRITAHSIDQALLSDNQTTAVIIDELTADDELTTYFVIYPALVDFYEAQSLSETDINNLSAKYSQVIDLR